MSAEIRKYNSGGLYLRFRVSPSTIKKAVSLGGQITQTVIGVDSIATGLKLKKSLQRQHKVAMALESGKSVAEIASGVAFAISELIK